MVLLIGASGLLGTEIVRNLTSKGVELKLSTRNPQKLAKEQPGVDRIHYLDITRPDTYSTSFSGVDTVIISIHSLFGIGENSSPKVDGKGLIQLINYMASLGNQIKHVVLISILNPEKFLEIEFFRYKLEAERKLISSGLPFSIVQPAAFMELHIAELMGKDVLNNRKVKLMGNGNLPCGFVSIKDVAQLIEQILNHGPTYSRMPMCSPDKLSRREVIEKYAEKLGVKSNVFALKPGTVLKLSSIMRFFHSGLARMMQMAGTMDSADTTEDAASTYNRFQLEPTRIDEFIDSHILNYRRGNFRV